ncbi:MAG: hypothetical protein QE271_13215 [Bacteriovoracaceae bacterium]|nr:hypothetical protein [Bacteriovoracaceae bacterium]
MVKNLFFIIAVIIFVSSLKLTIAEEFDVRYFAHTFGHVHKTPFAYADSKTTIQCGQAIKVFSKSPSPVKDWSYVKVGEELGHIQTSYLLKEKPNFCFQQKYPIFFQSLNLDLSDLYYWGRIYDHAIEFTSGS